MTDRYLTSLELVIHARFMSAMSQKRIQQDHTDDAALHPKQRMRLEFNRAREFQIKRFLDSDVLIIGKSPTHTAEPDG